MIAGYFTVIACDKKGPSPFLKDRALRLGIPLLGWAVFMAVLQMFLTPTPATGYTLGIPWPVEVAHMWFVQQLLIFCGAYAVGRMLLPAGPNTGKPARVPRVVGHRALYIRSGLPLGHHPHLVRHGRVGVPARLRQVPAVRPCA